MRKVLIILVVCLLLCGCKLITRENKKIEYLTGKHNVEMKIKNYGIIKLELDADSAPISTTNFIKLVNENFYEGLTFHRILNGFMMQGGADFNGRVSDNIKGEFQENGINNPIKHTRGTISMARSNDFNSGSTQFFIMHKDNDSLDGSYAAFGHVTSGMDVVDKICTKVGKPLTDPNNGAIDADKQPIIEYIKVIDK